MMGELWASERADYRVEAPPPKCQCRTRLSILGTRLPPDNALGRQRRKLVAVTLRDLWQHLKGDYVTTWDM